MMKIILFVISLFIASSVFAGLDEGLAAANKGDFATALKEWQPLADQGNATAQNNLGVMYANGQGVAKDEAQAVQWYRKAADQGNATAQNNLGLMYANGRGVAKDEAQAVQWFRKAADQGYAQAQNYMGVMCEHGTGVLQDYALAADWYKKSARQGNAYGQRNLGLLYRDGKGVAENLIVSYSWLNLASAGGHPDAGKERDAVAESLTAKELQQAQQLSAKWTAGALIQEVSYKPKSDSKKKIAKAEDQQEGDGFPARPAKRPGVVSCNTQCTNADCYRTYDDGKKIRFRAKQKWNPFNNTFEWDSGAC